MSVKKKYTTPAPAYSVGFAIVNPWGEFWSTDVFGSESDAKIHFNNFWSSPGFKGNAARWEDYRVVKVRQTIEAIHP